MNRIYFVFSILLLFFFSCKTTTEPVKYDKKIDIITQEIQLIHLLISNENYEEAGSLIEKDLKLYQDDIELLNIKAWYFLQKGDFPEAETLFMQLIEKNKSNPLAYLGLGRLYRITGKNDQSLIWIKKGLSYSMILTGLWFEKGMIEYEEKNYKEALVDFSKSSNLDLKNNDALFFKYLTMLKLGRNYDDIKYIWENIIKSGNIKSYYFLYNAEHFYKEKKSDVALFLIKSGLLSFPENPYLLNFISFLQYEKYVSENKISDLEESEKNILSCLEKKSEPEFIDTYLLILELKKEKEKMKSLLDRYLIEFPDSPVLIEWLKKLK